MHEAGWSPIHRATATLNAHAAKLNNHPIASIDEPLVLQSPSSAVH
jgi:hypothetical protein